MAINLEIKHNDTSITNIQSGGVALNTAGKYCQDNLSFTLSGAEFWEGDIFTPPVKPTNLTPSAMHTGQEITNGYTCPAHVTMVGQDRGIEGGTYIATYTPEEGYFWSDNTTESVTVTLTINALVFDSFTISNTTTKFSVKYT